HFRGYAGDDRVVRHFARHHRPGADQREAPDRDAADDGGIRTYRSAASDARSDHPPVGLGLEPAFRRAGTWEGIVGKHHAMADKDLVLDHHAFADEGVGGNLAASADMTVLLDFDERTDFRPATN